MLLLYVFRSALTQPILRPLRMFCIGFSSTQITVFLNPEGGLWRLCSGTCATQEPHVCFSTTRRRCRCRRPFAAPVPGRLITPPLYNVQLRIGAAR